MPPWGGRNVVNGFGQQREIGGRINEFGALQKQVIVVAGKAFKEPQQLGVVLLVEVDACKLGWAQTLDVPCVKVLMANEAK